MQSYGTRNNCHGKTISYFGDTKRRLKTHVRLKTLSLFIFQSSNSMECNAPPKHSRGTACYMFVSVDTKVFELYLLTAFLHFFDFSCFMFFFISTLDKKENQNVSMERFSYLV